MEVVVCMHCEEEEEKMECRNFRIHLPGYVQFRMNCSGLVHIGGYWRHHLITPKAHTLLKTLDIMKRSVQDFK